MSFNAAANNLSNLKQTTICLWGEKSQRTNDERVKASRKTITGNFKSK